MRREYTPLTVTHPELSMEWSEKNYPFSADQETAGSHDKVWWKGTCGHEWQARVCNRARGARCPYCTGRMLLKGFNDFATRYPELVSEWSSKNDPLQPDQFVSHSNQRIIWQCSEGHEWTTSISNRAQGHHCPICQNQVLLPGYNDFATAHPELVPEWSEKNLPLQPNQIREKYNKQLWWHCPVCKQDYLCRIISRTQRGSCCPVCAGRKAVVGYNDLSTTDPEIAAEWNMEKNGNWKPTDLTRKYRKYIWWNCPCGHVWGARIYDRTFGGVTCTVCDAEFQGLRAQLLTLLYAERFHVPVRINAAVSKHITFELYLPKLRIGIDSNGISYEQKYLQNVKAQRCAEQGIRYFVFSRSLTDEETAKEVRSVFESIGNEIETSVEEDFFTIREQFRQTRKEIYEESLKGDKTCRA